MAHETVSTSSSPFLSITRCRPAIRNALLWTRRWRGPRTCWAPLSGQAPASGGLCTSRVLPRCRTSTSQKITCSPRRTGTSGAPWKMAMRTESQRPCVCWDLLFLIVILRDGAGLHVFTCPCSVTVCATPACTCVSFTKKTLRQFLADRYLLKPPMVYISCDMKMRISPMVHISGDMFTHGLHLL